MALAPGVRLGPYAITAQIGASLVTRRPLADTAVRTFPSRLQLCEWSASCAGRPWG